jgi:hypothetical protein
VPAVRRLFRELRRQLRWMWGVSEMSLSDNLEYDEERGEIRRKP